MMFYDSGVLETLLQDSFEISLRDLDRTDAGSIEISQVYMAYDEAKSKPSRKLPQSGDRVLVKTCKKNATEMQAAEIIDTYLDNNKRVKYMLRLGDASYLETYRSTIFTESEIANPHHGLVQEDVLPENKDFSSLVSDVLRNRHLSSNKQKVCRDWVLKFPFKLSSWVQEFEEDEFETIFIPLSKFEVDAILKSDQQKLEETLVVRLETEIVQGTETFGENDDVTSKIESHVPESEEPKSLISRSVSTRRSRTLSKNDDTYSMSSAVRSLNSRKDVLNLNKKRHTGFRIRVDTSDSRQFGISETDFNFDYQYTAPFFVLRSNCESFLGLSKTERFVDLLLNSKMQGKDRQDALSLLNRRFQQTCDVFIQHLSDAETSGLHLQLNSLDKGTLLAKFDLLTDCKINRIHGCESNVRGVDKRSGKGP
eukprot:765123-Hanusia_phi.AAC.1